MKELFGYSVPRPVENSIQKALVLATQPPRGHSAPAAPEQTFEHSMHTLAGLKQGVSNGQIWIPLEEPAATFLAVATSAITGDPLLAALAAFITDAIALGADAWPTPDVSAPKVQPL